MSKKRSTYLIKNVGILTISNFTSKIMVFLLVPLYTRILTTAEYGIYDLVISTLQLIFPIFSVNISDAVMRYLMEKSLDKENVIKIGIKYITLSIIPVIIFLYLCERFNFWGDIKGFILVIFCYYISYAYNQFLIQCSKGLELVTDMAFSGILGTIVLLLSNILFLLVFNKGLSGFFWANVLSQAIPAIYLTFKVNIFKYIKVKVRDNQLRIEMLNYCIPLIFSVIGWWVNNAADKYVVTLICGAAANGILSVAYKIPSILNTFQSIFIQAWQISAVKEFESRDSEEFYGNIFVLLNILMGVIAAVLIFLSRPIAVILYANEFYSAWRYVPFLLVTNVINSASGFLGPILSAMKDSKSMAKSAIYGTLVNIFLNILFVKYFGVQGATVATAISSFAIYYVRRIAVKDNIKITSIWKVYTTWMILCIHSFISIFTLPFYCEIVMIAIIIFINKKELLIVINKFLKVKGEKRK